MGKPKWATHGTYELNPFRPKACFRDVTSLVSHMCCSTGLRCTELRLGGRIQVRRITRLLESCTWSTVPAFKLA